VVDALDDWIGCLAASILAVTLGFRTMKTESRG
jgi:hypothetical protein